MASAREATDTPAVVATRCTAIRRPWAGFTAVRAAVLLMVARRAMVDAGVFDGLDVNEM
jgi:hypothetical protein